MTIDPVTFAVVRGSLEQIADEMDLHLIRAALSPILSETNDCAHGFYDPASGEMIAQGGYGLPLFLANMQFTVQAVIRAAAEDGGFGDGDIWITNDPYLSGTHLQDTVLVAPYYSGGELVTLMACTGHLMDVGGSVPGGWVPTAREIHQEGFLIPPVRLQDSGRFNHALLRTILANSRLAEQMQGDLAAMANVFAVGRRGLDALLAKFGLPAVRACIADMMVRSETQMRAVLRDIPDGTYRFEDYFDNDGVEDRRLTVALAARIAGDRLTLDFTGTSPIAAGPMNISAGTAKSMCLVALRHLFPDLPVNGGSFRPVGFAIPEGCLLNARYPAPVGGTTDVTHRVLDVLFGCLAQAVPERTPAAPHGTTGVVTFSGRKANGAFYVAVFPYPGGYGGSAVSDGLVNGTAPGSMAKFMSIEMSEHRYPLRFDRFAIREGSGGAGRHRGGCGTEYSITALSDCVVSVLGDRVDHPPFGIAGGHPAAPNRVRFVTGGREWTPDLRSKAEKIALKAGDRVEVASPGGGGFGDPRDRNPAAVARDLDDGIIDRATARTTYGIRMAPEGKQHP